MPKSMSENLVITVDDGHGLDSPMAYVMAACAFMVQFSVLGGINSFGIFLDEFQDDEDLGKPSKSEVSLVVSLANGLIPFVGVFTGKAVDRWGPRIIQTTAGVTLFAGLFLSSYCRSFPLFLSCFGLIMAVSGGCTIAPGLAAVGKWFDKDRALGFGITYAGSSAGTTVVPFVAQQLKSAYGGDQWRIPFRWLSLFSIPAVIAGLLIRPRLPLDHVHTDAPEPLKTKQILTNKIVIVLFSTGFLFAWGFFTFVVYAVAYAQAGGDSPYESRSTVSDSTASIVLSVFGITQTVGNVVWGIVAQKHGNPVTFKYCNLICGFGMAAWPWCSKISTQMVFSGLFGFFVSGCLTCYPGVIADHFAGPQLGNILSIIYLGFGLGGLVGPPSTGLFIEATGGSYLLPAMVCAGNYIIAYLLMQFVLPKNPTAMERLPGLLEPGKQNTIDSSPISPMGSGRHNRPKFETVSDYEEEERGVCTPATEKTSLLSKSGVGTYAAHVTPPSVTLSPSTPPCPVEITKQI